MKRRRVNPRRDRKIFKKVANKVKAINISPKVMRGGIRL